MAFDGTVSGLASVLAGLALLGAGAVLGAWWAQQRLLRAARAAGPEEISGIDALRREIERARRYERPFTLLFVPNDAFEPTADDTGVPVDRPALHTLTASLRALDFAWQEADGIHVVLPEAAHDESDACVRRLCAAVPGLDGSMVRSAVFPDDGVTFGSLFATVAGDVEVLPDRNDLPMILRGTPTKVDA